MKIQTKDQNLKEFLTFSSGQREVSLVVAKNKKELKEFKKELENSGFIQEKNINDIIKLASKGVKVFVEYAQEIKKELYDFIIQYPSGQIYLFDTEKNKPIFITPEYGESSILILITKEDLRSFQLSGFNILQNVGLTFQSN